MADIIIPVFLFFTVAVVVKYVIVPYLIAHEQDAVESIAMMAASKVEKMNESE
jgi:hypothetical protein